MERYYFYDDRNLIVYYSENFTDRSDLIYLGTSDNRKPLMAAAAFTKNMQINSGYKIRQLP